LASIKTTKKGCDCIKITAFLHEAKTSDKQREEHCSQRMSDNGKVSLNEILEQPKNQRYGRVKKNSIIRTHQNLSLILLPQITEVIF
jgi:hypothetical protein